MRVGPNGEWLMRARSVFHSLRVRLVAQTQQQFTIVDLDMTRFGVLFAVVRPAPGRQSVFSPMIFICSMSSLTLSSMKPVSRQGLMVAWFAVQPDAASCSALGRSEGRRGLYSIHTYVQHTYSCNPPLFMHTHYTYVHAYVCKDPSYLLNALRLNSWRHQVAQRTTQPSTLVWRRAPSNSVSMKT